MVEPTSCSRTSKLDPWHVPLSKQVNKSINNVNLKKNKGGERQTHCTLLETQNNTGVTGRMQPSKSSLFTTRESQDPNWAAEYMGIGNSLGFRFFSKSLVNMALWCI